MGLAYTCRSSVQRDRNEKTAPPGRPISPLSNSVRWSKAREPTKCFHFFMGTACRTDGPVTLSLVNL